MNISAKCLTLKHNYKELSHRVFESNALSLQWYIFNSHLRSSPKGTEHKSATLPNWENKWSSCFTHKWALLAVNNYGEIYYLISSVRPLSNATRCSSQLSVSCLKALMMLASFLHNKKKKKGFLHLKAAYPSTHSNFASTSISILNAQFLQNRPQLTGGFTNCCRRLSP